MTDPCTRCGRPGAYFIEYPDIDKGIPAYLNLCEEHAREAVGIIRKYGAGETIVNLGSFADKPQPYIPEKIAPAPSAVHIIRDIFVLMYSRELGAFGSSPHIEKLIDELGASE